MNNCVGGTLHYPSHFFASVRTLERHIPVTSQSESVVRRKARPDLNSRLETSSVPHRNFGATARPRADATPTTTLETSMTNGLRPFSVVCQSLPVKSKSRKVESSTNRLIESTNGSYKIVQKIYKSKVTSDIHEIADTK